MAMGSFLYYQRIVNMKVSSEHLKKYTSKSYRKPEHDARTRAELVAESTTEKVLTTHTHPNCSGVVAVTGDRHECV